MYSFRFKNTSEKESPSNSCRTLESLKPYSSDEEEQQMTSFPKMFLSWPATSKTTKSWLTHSGRPCVGQHFLNRMVGHFSFSPHDGGVRVEL